MTVVIVLHLHLNQKPDCLGCKSELTAGKGMGVPAIRRAKRAPVKATQWRTVLNNADFCVIVKGELIFISPENVIKRIREMIQHPPTLLENNWTFPFSSFWYNIHLQPKSLSTSWSMSYIGFGVLCPTPHTQRKMRQLIDIVFAYSYAFSNFILFFSLFMITAALRNSLSLA